jgi:FtsX-like permease family
MKRWPSVSGTVKTRSATTSRARGDAQHTLEIIGVVKKSRTEDPYSPYSPTLYVPISQNYTSAQTPEIRTAGPPQSLAPEVLAVVRAIAPTAPILSVRSMTDLIENGPGGLLIFNLGAELTGALGLLGLVLAVVGIYGVMAYAVGQRTPEIGVRLALGAQGRGVLTMVLSEGVSLMFAGVAIGLLYALALTRLLGSLLYGVSATDPLALGCVAMLFAVVALIACYVPARRAVRLDPVVALREE